MTDAEFSCIGPKEILKSTAFTFNLHFIVINCSATRLNEWHLECHEAFEPAPDAARITTLPGRFLVQAVFGSFILGIWR